MSETCTTKGCSEPFRRQIGRSRFCEPHYQDWLAARCEALTWGDGRGPEPRCSFKAFKERDGRKVCAIHAHQRWVTYCKETPHD
ncbi:hypothetical protein LCGC14_1491860 [marine sediment metagenome]|uniref:Uncharacterized protein n=1 Tax=marine sediment metagenome TaxID=412755 RepID=A0A0F9JSG8_9ZZZZ